MIKLSREIPINKEDIMKSEFFRYEKEINDSELNTVENFILFGKKNRQFIPLKINTFDLKTFIEVWYRLNVREIPISDLQYNQINNKKLEYKLHTHPKMK